MATLVKQSGENNCRCFIFEEIIENMKIKECLKAVVCLLVLGALQACNFNQSVKKDLITGAYSRGNGLSCDEIVMEVNGEPAEKTKFALDDNINIIFNDVFGFQEKENRVFPGLSIIIVKNEKDTVAVEPDLFKEMRNGTKDFVPALQIQANYSIVPLFEKGEKYKAKIKIWDKKGEGTFDYEFPFGIEK